MVTASEFTILAVDDSDIILELLQIQLTAEGYNITTVNNGEKAMKLAEDVKFDLILLDIEMPRVSGIEVLQFIRQTTTNTDTPVIMLTAQNDSSNVSACLNNGARDYILKPFNMVSVKQRIWKILQNTT